MIDVVSYHPFQRQLPGMHDNNGMSASQVARMSPGDSMQPLHPVPRDIQHTSVIKKLDHSVESFIPNSKQNIEHSTRPVYGIRPEVAYTCMDDDFSDHDSHYSEDFIDDTEDIELFDEQPQPDVTRQLLDFATMVSGDIQKFFGRKKGEEDSCDVYEDKWVSTKSGRELYYADLMKIVQGEDKPTKGRKARASPSLLDISASEIKDNDNRGTFTGKPDKKIGIGPLNELFEYGLRDFLSDRKLKHTKELKRLKTDSKRFDGVTPMLGRKLPTSFWHEPGAQQLASTDVRTNTTTTVLQTNNPPDFSDLLESWRLDRNEFSGDISSTSEVSMSPESS